MSYAYNYATNTNMHSIILLAYSVRSPFPNIRSLSFFPMHFLNTFSAVLYLLSKKFESFHTVYASHALFLLKG